MQRDCRYLQLTATHAHLGGASRSMLFDFCLWPVRMNSHLLWTDRVELEVVRQVELAD